MVKDVIMQNEDLEFHIRHSSNVHLCNGNKSAQIVTESRVLRTCPSLLPGLKYKLIVEGKGKIDIFLTPNQESFAQQTTVTLHKVTYDTHIYYMQLKLQDEACSERSGYYNFVVEEESKVGSEHTRQAKDFEDEAGKQWALLFKLEGDITLITIVTEGGQMEDRLTFVDDGKHSNYLSADKFTFRSDIEYTEVCFGDRPLNKNESVVLRVTRSERNGFCKIAVLSEEHFRRLTSTNDSFRYRKHIKSLPQVVLRSNILHDPTTSQIVATVPMAASGRPVFIFFGCTLDLCSDITRPRVSEETTPKEIDKTTNEVEEKLCQVHETLASFERRLNQKERVDQEHHRKMMDQMEANHRKAEMQSTSLLDLRNRQLDIQKNVIYTRKTVEKTGSNVKRISEKFNKRLSENMGSDDKSLELLSKYINPNYHRIKKSLDENEFMDYLRQYDVLTERQHEEIRSGGSGEQRREKLLNILCKKPVSKLPNVRKALQKSGNKNILQYFEED